MPRHMYNPLINYKSTNKMNVVEYYSRRAHKRKIKVKARIADFKGKKIIAWKKAIISRGVTWKPPSYCLVKLEIPAKAARYQPRNYKCRSSSAKVLEIYRLSADFYGNYTRAAYPDNTIVACSRRDPSFTYKVGNTVKPKFNFSRDYKHECRSGIHFFLTEKEALVYRV